MSGSIQEIEPVVAERAQTRPLGRGLRRGLLAGIIAVGSVPAVATAVSSANSLPARSFIPATDQFPRQEPPIFENPQEIPFVLSATHIQCRGWVPGLADEIVYTPAGQQPERTISIGCIKNWKNNNWSGVKIADRSQYPEGPFIQIGCKVNARNCISPREVQRVITEKRGKKPMINVVMCNRERPANFIQVAPRVMIDPGCIGRNVGRTRARNPEFIKVFCRDQGKDSEAPPEHVKMRQVTMNSLVCVTKFSWYTVQFEIYYDKESRIWKRRTPQYSFGNGEGCWTVPDC